MAWSLFPAKHICTRHDNGAQAPSSRSLGRLACCLQWRRREVAATWEGVALPRAFFHNPKTRARGHFICGPWAGWVRPRTKAQQNLPRSSRARRGRVSTRKSRTASRKARSRARARRRRSFAARAPSSAGATGAARLPPPVARWWPSLIFLAAGRAGSQSLCLSVGRPGHNFNPPASCRSGPSVFRRSCTGAS